MSLEGAGGIGGLLARSSGYSGGNWTSHADYFADGNGNITSLIDNSQNVAASYRYDPFGNIISKSGTLADANVYRFSSKEVHVASGMYYYGFRFYDPNLQRWINQDPTEEFGGINLYGFVANASVNLVDFDGLGWVQKVKGICQAAQKAKLALEMAERLRQLQKSARSLARNVAKHKQTLKDYLKNPEKMDNKGFLKNAPNDKIRQQIIQSRKEHLEGEIANWEKQIASAENEICEIKSAQNLLASCACSILIPHTTELNDLQRQGNNITIGQFASGAALDLAGAVDPGILDLVEYIVGKAQGVH